MFRLDRPRLQIRELDPGWPNICRSYASFFFFFFFKLNYQTKILFIIFLWCAIKIKVNNIKGKKDEKFGIFFLKISAKRLNILKIRLDQSI